MSNKFQSYELDLSTWEYYVVEGDKKEPLKLKVESIEAASCKNWSFNKPRESDLVFLRAEGGILFLLHVNLPQVVIECKIVEPPKPVLKALIEATVDEVVKSVADNLRVKPNEKVLDWFATSKPNTEAAKIEQVNSTFTSQAELETKYTLKDVEEYDAKFGFDLKALVAIVAFQTACNNIPFRLKYINRDEGKVSYVCDGFLGDNYFVVASNIGDLTEAAKNGIRLTNAKELLFKAALKSELAEIPLLWDMCEGKKMP